jgi:hypothetical protein
VPKVVLEYRRPNVAERGRRNRRVAAGAVSLLAAAASVFVAVVVFAIGLAGGFPLFLCVALPLSLCFGVATALLARRSYLLLWRMQDA